MVTSSVDLEQLKRRLAKLGVHIDAEAEAKDDDKYASCEARLERTNTAVAKLLDKCNTVQQALNKSEEAAGARLAVSTSPAKASSQSLTNTRVGRRLQASTSAATGSCITAAAARVPACGPDNSSIRASAIRGAAAAAAQPPPPPPAVAATATAGSSKLLLRAAQKLLADAQAEAKQLDRAMVPAGKQQPRQQLLPHQRTAATATAAAAEDLRTTPLGTVLAQYKEAQAAWAQEKAKLRREAVASRKKAAKLELELARVSRLQQHTSLDVATLKAALKGRDVQLEESAVKVKQLQEALARSQEAAAEKLVSLQAERDDLQALLLATLAKLEGVQAVVAAADDTSAAMEAKVRRLEAEQLAAMQDAAEARAEVTALQDSQRRLQWQSQLLQRMNEVQLRHNKRKSAAIQELLSSAAAADQACSTSSGGASSGGRRQPAGDSPVTALHGMFDELLRAAAADETDDESSGGNDDNEDDDEGQD